MNNKVYCVDDFFDNIIIEGIAKYNNEKYYFECIFSNEKDYWTNEYYLTLLNESIFKMAMENWEYWEKWLKQSIIPHPVEYAKRRRTMTANEILSGINIEDDLLELTEKYYQNEIIIEKYLEDNKPIYKAQGTFYGNINGINHTEVKWENIRKMS
jgi:hypothetical protein